LNALQQAVGYVETDPAFTLAVKAEDAPKVYALQAHGVFALMERAADDPTTASEAKGYSLEDLLGLEDPPQQAPTHSMWTTEYALGGRMTGKQFPVRLPSPEQVAAYQEAMRKHLEEQGLGPDGKPLPGGAKPAKEKEPSAGGQTRPTSPRPAVTSPPPSAVETPPATATTKTPEIPSPFANDDIFAPPTSPASPQVPSPQIVPTNANATGSSDPCGDDNEPLEP
jgi:hypothetical protein